MVNLLDLTTKQAQLKQYQPLPDALLKNLRQWYHIALTYNSNAIEGNTLTHQETALVAEKGVTIGGKSLREHLEVINHVKALEYIETLLPQKPQQITLENILTIHKFILKDIDDDSAGRYRNVAVRISGSEVVMPNPLKIPNLMQNFIQWLQHTTGLHPVQLAADAHFKLVSIHPFIDGNGRTARLLMNLILLQSGYPYAIVRAEDRLAYLKALEKGQTSKDIMDYYQIIYEAVERSLDDHLKVIRESKS